MFNALFDIISAWNSLLYLMAGGFCSGLGLLVVGYAFYIRAREHAYRGEIVGVRTDGSAKGIFWPVVAYTDAQGQRHEALANSGSSAISTPGTTVTVFADPAAPNDLMLARDWWLLAAIGAFIAAVGSPFIAMGFRGLHFTWGTAVVALALAGYAGFKLFPVIHPFLDARKAGDWKATREAFAARLAQRQNMQPVSDAQIASLSAAQGKQAATVLPVVMVVGLALLIGGGVWFEQTKAFTAQALSADGTVVRNEASESGGDGSTTYHAVVAFTDRSGNTVTYRDSVGTAPAWYSPGDKVRVYYLPQDSSRAMIDRGLWNGLVPLLIGGVGALLLFGGVYGFLARRRDVILEAPKVGA